MDKNHLIANDFYLLATPGCNYTQNYTDVILKGRHGDLNCKKLANTSHHKKSLNLIFENKIRFLRFFWKDFFKKW